MIRKRYMKAVLVLLIMGHVLMLAAEGLAAGKKYLSLGTANPSGTYYFLGAGFAAIFNKYVPEVRVVAESTAGAEENFNYILRKKMDLGLSALTVIPPALEKQRDLGGIRILALGHSSECHWIVRKESPIKSIADFRGRTIAVGAPGSGTLIMAKEVLKSVGGFSFDDFKPAYLSFTESIAALKDRTIDVGLVWAACPVASILDLSQQVPIRLIPLSAKEIKTLTDAKPYYVKVAIPGGTYRGIEENTTTFGGIAGLFCRQDLSEELVEKLIGALFEHPKEKDAIHSQAKQWNLDNIFRGADYTTKYIPFHPGAIKYLKRKDLWKE